jgi:hypothetical protein
MASYGMVWPASYLKKHIDIFPQGQLCAEINGQIISSAGSLVDHITQLEVATHSHRQQSISTFNKATAVAALASSAMVSTMRKPLNKCNSNSAVLVFLFSVIALGLFSLSVSAIMVNAQAPSNTTSGSSNSTSNETGVKQMGICQEGVKSPCNGVSNSTK